MRLWSHIRNALEVIFAIVLPVAGLLLTIVGPLVLIAWGFKSGHYLMAAAGALLYLVLAILMRGGSRTMRHMDMAAYKMRIEPEPIAPPLSPVDFSVYAPMQISRGTSFMLNLWVHLHKHLPEVMGLAQLQQATEMVGLRSGVPVSLGAEIVLRLHLPTLKVRDNMDKIAWTGSPSNATFRVNVPDDTLAATHHGHFDIYTGGIRIARLLFDISLSSEKTTTAYRRIDSRLDKIRTAFASYSSNDREDVLARLQGMKKIAPDLDIFIDALSLRSGDLWETRLAEEVVSKDIFYLFWSRNAAQSTWVNKEWQHALGSRGLDYIDPVPLETPEVAPPPSALRALHFGDAFATFAFLQKSIRKSRTDS